MHDIYTESIVAAKPTWADRMKSIAYLLLTILSAVFYITGSTLMLIPMILFGYLVYKNPLRAKKEYEYIHVNDTLDIDLVTQTRKNLCTVDLNQVAVIAPVNSSGADGYRHLKAVDYSGGASLDMTYILVHSKDGKQEKLQLCLEKKMYESLRQRIPQVMR